MWNESYDPSFEFAMKRLKQWINWMYIWMNMKKVKVLKNLVKSRWKIGTKHRKFPEQILEKIFLRFLYVYTILKNAIQS